MFGPALKAKWTSSLRVIDAPKATLQRYVQRIVRTGSCRLIVPGATHGKGISDDFAYNASKTSHILLVGMALSATSPSHHKAAYVPVAFLCARVVPNPTKTQGNAWIIHVDATCSSGGGTSQLFARIHALADGAATDVALDAVPASFGFYSKPELGYEFRASCAPGAAVIDAAPVRGRKVTPDTLRAEFGPFMRELHLAGLSANNSVACKSRASADMIFERACFDEGYAMQRCYKSPSPTRALSRSRLRRTRSRSKDGKEGKTRV